MILHEIKDFLSIIVGGKSINNHSYIDDKTFISSSQTGLQNIILDKLVSESKIKEDYQLI